MIPLEKPIIGITMGDAAGIGPEVVAKAYLSREVARICRPIVIGSKKIMKQALRSIKAGNMDINAVKNMRDARFIRGLMDVYDVGSLEPSKVKVGQISATCGKAAVEYFKTAIELAMDKKIDGISTAPINKEAIHKAGFKYQGHTEILAEMTKSKNYAMMFVSDSLWVILVTTHLPLHDVSKHIDKKKVLNTIKIANNITKKLRGKKPRIGVAGLNPHAGESGIFGKEEQKIIKPAVAEARKAGIDVKGPISPDAVFYLASVGMFDIVVAMYHDQGLIPLKLLSFNHSVNVTAGLPIIRTSVDHGTGFDIAGKGWANPQSLIEAIRVAVFLAHARNNKK
jgi:4-hydroxythreonine-4-phosphate dehydrogenase